MAKRMKDLPAVDRPREKLLKYGPDKLDDAELLAIVLGSGVRGMNVRTLARKILREQKQKLSELTIEDLKNTKGLGPAKAAQVVAVMELGRRLFGDKLEAQILSPEDVWKQCADFRTSKKEHFVAFYLNTRNVVIEREIISIGTLNASLVHPREVFEPAVRLHAAAIILAHNHPSGNTDPSPEDLEVTDRLARAGELLGIKVLDHIVITNKDWFSIIDRNG